MNQKGSAILSILVLLLLAAGVAFGIYKLQGNQQIIRSRAGNDPIVITNNQGKSLPSENNSAVTDTRDVQVQLNVPSAPAN